MKKNLLLAVSSIVLLGCKFEHEKKPTSIVEVQQEVSSSSAPLQTTPEGMVWIPGGTFYQGALSRDNLAMAHEKPRHKVVVDGFFMDEHEVTNAQFSAFVQETGYITLAERPVDWEQLKQQLPQGTPKPHDSILQPGALVFVKSKASLPNLYNYSQWWAWKIGANWKHPNGPDSSIKGKEDHPVVQIAYEDAVAYCEWAGKALPTEAEWEYAARAGKDDGIYFWGNDTSKISSHSNTWEGEFPVKNTINDGFEKRAPVKSYPKNAFGLYDMAGNVWEWTSDWYDTYYYQKLAATEISKNPKGPQKPFNEHLPMAQEKVIKGGSFLCSDSYCASYRISARMANSTDSGSEHVGFRAVVRP